MATELQHAIRWFLFFTAVMLYFFLLISLYEQETNLVTVPVVRGFKQRNPTEKALRDNQTVEEEETKTSENLTEAPKCSREIQIQHWVGQELPKTPDFVQCPGFECVVRYVANRNFEMMKSSDIVIHDFHLSGHHWNWDAMQEKRLPNQTWAFYALEPRTLPTRTEYAHLYNYTITYRRESTFVAPYGMYYPTKPTIPKDDTRNWASGRPKMVAWMASNCHGYTWNRFGFVKELSKHIPVDIYGGCGKLPCSRASDGCWRTLRTYKFYLALENSECRDYITEKYWMNALKHNLLPIVHGPPKEDYERVAPPNSFIHLQDFASMEALVKYLNLLSSNDTLYNSYFEWKHSGSSGTYWLHDEVKCKMAARFYTDLKTNGHSKVGANSTLYDFWQGRCSLNVTGFPHDF